MKQNFHKEKTMTTTTQQKTNKQMVDIRKIQQAINPITFQTTTNLETPEFNKHGDSIRPVIKTIPVNQIDQYSFNPRKVDNNLFKEIKQSIQEIGLQQMFSVVRNPDTKRYILNKGGNTRLKVIKQLFQETKEDRFGAIQCVVEPWDGEINKTQAVIAHLVENETRGELILVDKAKALVELEKEFKKESEESLDSSNNYKTKHTKKECKESLHSSNNYKTKHTKKECKESLHSSNNYKTKHTKPFLEYLASNGYPVSKAQLSVFRFTASKLVGNLDYFLNQGLGSPQIIKIRGVYNNLKRLIKDTSYDDQSLDKDFSAALKKYNKTKKSFDFENLLDTLIEQLSEIYPFWELFHGKEAFRKALLSSKKLPEQSKNTKPDSSNSNNLATQSQLGKSNINMLQKQLQTQETLEPVAQEQDDINTGADTNQQVQQPTTDNSRDSALQLELLRKQARVLINKITNKIHINKTVQEIETGCGFILIDTFDKNNFEHWGVWWLILGYSHAADLLNPIIDLKDIKPIPPLELSGTGQETQSFDEINVDTKLEELYFNVSAGHIEDVDVNLSNINKLSDMYEFRSTNLQCVKDMLTPHLWQDMTELEAVCYQIIRVVATSEDVTLWGNV